MIYITLNFYIFLTMVLFGYYCLPVKKRWIVLLVANCYFYYAFYKTGWWIIIGTALLTFCFAQLFAKAGRNLLLRRALLIFSIICVILPWFIAKDSVFVFGTIFGKNISQVIVPLGISFYTMELIAYLVDVYEMKIDFEDNFFKFVLFVTFFPKLIQGPISRYGQLSKQLIDGQIFNENMIVKGFYNIIWGFFLKLVIADKAGIVVDNVFDNFPAYTGIYIWIGSILYSIQLYADFLACTTLARGIAYLFGVELTDNFIRPYFSKSIKEFWRRWHISLSLWLKDYVYIPLGGSRKGTVRKYINLIVTFLVSGIWHGAGYKYLFWALMHATFQIIEGGMDVSKRNPKSLEKQSRIISAIKITVTLLEVNFAWIIFRASSLTVGLKMIKQMFTVFNPWILFNDRIFTLGLSWKEFFVLSLSIILLFRVGKYQEEKGSVSEQILSKSLPIRWGICIFGILCVVIFGTYGFGYNNRDFIYGGF